MPLKGMHLFWSIQSYKRNIKEYEIIQENIYKNIYCRKSIKWGNNKDKRGKVL